MNNHGMLSQAYLNFKGGFAAGKSLRSAFFPNTTLLATYYITLDVSNRRGHLALSFSLVLQVKITFVACVCCFCLGLPCASYSGQYVLDLMDTYGAGFAVTFVGIWELVSLMWIYGVKNVCKDIKLMLGSEPGWFWKVITRFFLAFLAGIFFHWYGGV